MGQYTAPTRKMRDSHYVVAHTRSGGVIDGGEQLACRPHVGGSDYCLLLIMEGASPLGQQQITSQASGREVWTGAEPME